MTPPSRPKEFPSPAAPGGILARRIQRGRELFGIGRSAVRASGLVAALTGADLVVGLLYQWYVLARLGPRVETDALYAGMMVPQLVLVALTNPLSQVLVPILSVHDEEGFSQTVWTFIQGIALCLGGLALAGWLTAGVWVPLTVPAFAAEAQALTTRLVRIQLIGLALGAASSVLWTAQQARRQFVRAAAIPLAVGLVGFPILVWGLPRFGVTAAAWIGVAKAAAVCLLLLPTAGPYRPPRWRTPETREAWRRMWPLLSRSAYFKADIVVDRFLAAHAPVGSLSLLALARGVYNAGVQIMNRAVTAPAIPTLAVLAERRAWADFRRVRNRRAAWATALAVGSLIVLVAFGRPMLGLFFRGSSFGPDELTQIWRLLVVLSGVWVAGVACQVLAGAFYARGDTETPTRVGVVSFTVGVGLKVVGFYSLGILGIAAGASLHYVLMLALLVRAGRAIPAGGGGGAAPAEAAAAPVAVANVAAPGDALESAPVR